MANITDATTTEAAMARRATAATTEPRKKIKN